MLSFMQPVAGCFGKDNPFVRAYSATEEEERISSKGTTPCGRLFIEADELVRAFKQTAQESIVNGIIWSLPVLFAHNLLAFSGVIISFAERIFKGMVSLFQGDIAEGLCELGKGVFGLGIITVAPIVLGPVAVTVEVSVLMTALFIIRMVALETSEATLGGKKWGEA